MTFMALLPNDVTQDPSVAASFRFVALRFRFAAWLRHRMAALCRGSRDGDACALPFRRGLSSPQPEPVSFRHFIPLARSAWRRYRSLHHRVGSAFPLRRPVDYDAKLTRVIESHQRKITAFACGLRGYRGQLYAQSRIVQPFALDRRRNGPWAFTAKASSAQSIAGASDTWSL